MGTIAVPKAMMRASPSSTPGTKGIAVSRIYSPSAITIMRWKAVWASGEIAAFKLVPIQSPRNPPPMIMAA
jgi:hypothetical protein